MRIALKKNVTLQMVEKPLKSIIHDFIIWSRYIRSSPLANRAKDNVSIASESIMNVREWIDALVAQSRFRFCKTARKFLRGT